MKRSLWRGSQARRAHPRGPADPRRVELAPMDDVLTGGDAGVRTREGAQHPLTAYGTNDASPTSEDDETPDQRG